MRGFKAIIKFEFRSPYSQSRHISTPKLERESGADYEERTWRERMHTDKKGFVFIPPSAFKNGLSEAAKYLNKQIPGKGKSTYTKHFEAGVLVMDPVPLPIKAEDVPGEWLFVPSDGRRGGGKRVEKCFGKIDDVGELEATIYILDPIITKEVFADVLTYFSAFIGLGRFRPRNNGWYGRFEIKDIQWIEEDF